LNGFLDVDELLKKEEGFLGSGGGILVRFNWSGV